MTMTSARPHLPESEAAQAFRMQLEASGYAVEYWSSGPGAILMGLELREDGLIYVDAGEAVLEVEETEFVLRAGDQKLVPRGAPHSIRNRGKSPLTWLSAVRILGG